MFTFIAEHDGATDLEQVTGSTLEEAVRAWNEAPGHLRLSADRLEGDPPTPLDGLRGVWCFSGLDELDTLYIVHVIETVDR
ncbi:MAG TPA: hypothetical protein VF911_12880 [Thermoanaerobaculia bacterium]